MIKIKPEEMHKRLENVNFAWANIGLEGFVPSMQDEVDALDNVHYFSHI